MDCDHRYIDSKVISLKMGGNLLYSCALHPSGSMWTTMREFNGAWGWSVIEFCETQFNWARTWRLWGWVAFSGAQTPSTSPHSSGTTRKSRVWESPPLIWRAPKRRETEKSRPPSLPPAARQPGVMPANPKGTQILHQPLPGRKWRV